MAYNTQYNLKIEDKIKSDYIINLIGMAISIYKNESSDEASYMTKMIFNHTRTQGMINDSLGLTLSFRFKFIVIIFKLFGVSNGLRFLKLLSMIK